MYKGYFVSGANDPTGTTFKGSIEYMAIEVYLPLYPDTLATTYDGTTAPPGEFPVPREDTDATDTILEIENKKCAEVVTARTLTVNVKSVLPTYGSVVPNMFTPHGYTMMKCHEDRRRHIFLKAEIRYIKPVEKTGEVALKCGQIRRSTEGAAKEALQKYLDDNRAKAKLDFHNYSYSNQVALGRKELPVADKELKRGGRITGFAGIFKIHRYLNLSLLLAQNLINGELK